MTAIERKLHDQVQISFMTFGHGLNQVLYLCKCFGRKQSATWDWVVDYVVHKVRSLVAVDVSIIQGLAQVVNPRLCISLQGLRLFPLG